jgi:hypothetical protein
MRNGDLSTSYTDPQQQNLLTSRPYLFLITLQAVSTGVPSFDPNERVYYALVPQTKLTADGYSVVDHLNHLLTSDPNLEKLGMPYGLRYWLLQNTQALLQETSAVRAARQSGDIPTLRQHLVNIMYYLKGSSCAPGALTQAAQKTPLTPDSVTLHNSRASLLNCPQNTTLSGLLSHIETHMRGVVQAPGATPDQVRSAAQLQDKLVQVEGWLGQLQQDTLQLLQLPDDQLSQPAQQSTIDQMMTLANEVYGTAPPQIGARQIGDALQHLATFDVLPCPPASSPNNICMS